MFVLYYPFLIIIRQVFLYFSFFSFKVKVLIFITEVKMLNVYDCVEELNNKNWFKRQVKKSGILNPFLAVSKYEKLFYDNCSEYTKNNFSQIIPELKNKIISKKLITSDNELIDIWDINPYKSKKYIIFCSGISSEKTNPIQQFFYHQLVECGFGVIAFDYRGRGKSGGLFSQCAVFKDMCAVHKYLKNKKIKTKNIGLIGHSMGCAVALDFSCTDIFSFVVLINPFSKASDMAKCLLSKVSMPNVIKKILQFIPGCIFPLENKFNNENLIKKIKIPVYIIHTKNDCIIPLKLARKLFVNARKNKNISYTVLKGFEHELNEEKIQYCINYLKNFSE